MEVFLLNNEEQNTTKVLMSTSRLVQLPQIKTLNFALTDF